MLTLATYEPGFDIVHGDVDNDKYIVIYDYSTTEFYQNQWKDELKFYKRNVLKKVKYHQHPLIRNYKTILRKTNINLVEIVEENNICYCILHTYKINLLKKLWKKYKSNQN